MCSINIEIEEKWNFEEIMIDYNQTLLHCGISFSLKLIIFFLLDLIKRIKYIRKSVK